MLLALVFLNCSLLHLGFKEQYRNLCQWFDNGTEPVIGKVAVSKVFSAVDNDVNCNPDVHDDVICKHLKVSIILCNNV